jgi:DEAD/DEAH box helicase domain-containing protein
MRLAKSALETCACRHLKQDPKGHDPDGCYRCIRTYHLQYRSETISRERGIALLAKLITAGEQRVPQQELAALKSNSLFGSMLEKKFVDALKAFVGERNGTWEQTIIRGNQGFRFPYATGSRLRMSPVGGRWKCCTSLQVGRVPKVGYCTVFQGIF